jgi:hypothetical protein
MRPSLWAIPSSDITEELSITSTVSMAKTGTPFRQIRLSAFAYCSATPFILTEMRFLSCETISKEGNLKKFFQVHIKI